MYSPNQPRPAPSGPMTCARLRDWVLAATPNARVPYARGFVLRDVCSEELREYVMAVAALGYLTPHRIRGDDGVPVHIVQRTTRPIPKGARL